MLKLWVIPSFSCIFWIDDFLKFPIGQSTMTGERISHSHSQGFGEKTPRLGDGQQSPQRWKNDEKLGFPHSWIVWGKIRPMITGCTPSPMGFGHLHMAVPRWDGWLDDRQGPVVSGGRSGKGVDPTAAGATRWGRRGEPLGGPKNGGFFSMWIPSGKHTKNDGKSPFWMGKWTINGNVQ